MNRKIQQAFDFVVLNRTSLIGLGICVWLTKRVSGNMRELEKNT